MAPVATLWAAIDDACKRGRQGISYNAPQLSGPTATTSNPPVNPPDLINIELPKPYACPWRVTLLKMRWASPQSRTLVFTPSTLLPLDNQVDTGPGGQTTAGPSVQVEFGADALELAQVDYPWAGDSFDVTARVLRVYPTQGTAWGSSTRLPTIGAFAVPLVGGHGNSERRGPRFTYNEGIVSDGSPSIDFAVPARAVSYRIYSSIAIGVIAASASGWFCNAQQMSSVSAAGGWVANPICFDWDSSDVGDPSTLTYPQASSKWWPLDPRTEFVRVTQQVTGVGQQYQVGVQFLLDLG
jgi:hypothetical protein